jgi:hypothetical protein
MKGQVAYIGQPIAYDDCFKFFVEIDKEKHSQECNTEDEAIVVRKEVINQLREQGFGIRFL